MKSDPYYVILKRERENLCLSQAELAEKIGVSEDRIVRGWESGEHFPSPKHCQALCKLYGKSAQDLGISIRPHAHKRFPMVNLIDYRRIEGAPPPTYHKRIQQREKIVKEIYTELIQTDITAIALTGIAGVGKSTLAALIRDYAAEEYLAGKGPFCAKPLWLRVDPAVTMADLIGTIYESLGKPLPDLSRLSPQNLALVLFNVLDTADKPHFIILDQFENLLDWQTGIALSDRVGIGEWLDAINSQPCRSRILLTSRLWPQGTRNDPPTYLQEYHDGGLEIEQGMELLLKQEVKATKKELRTAVEYCKGHAFALTLLASLLRDHDLTLAALLNEELYFHLWTGNIASKLLDSIYQWHLNEVQRKLLVAFSAYREPVCLSAVQTILGLFKVPQAEIEFELHALLTQHLLQTYGDGLYQLHSIVTSAMHGHFVDNNVQANRQMKLLAHSKAAQYYQHQASKSCPPRESRRRMSDVQDLIEAIWQWCQAERWQEAYNLMQREGIFSDLTRWGGSSSLLGLFQQLLPTDKWNPKNTLKARFFNELSEIYNNLWQNNKALVYCQRALLICQEEEDYDGEARALANLGEIYSGLGENERAIEHCEQALHIFRKREDRDGEGKVLSILGWIYWVTGQKRRAMQHYGLALHIHREIGNCLGEGIALYGLGLVYYLLRQHEQALEYHLQSLRIRKQIGDLSGESRTLNALGLVYVELKQREQALDYFKQALRISKQIGERGGEARQLNNIGQICAALGQNERALDCYQQALRISRQVGDREGEEWVLTNLGKVHDVLGQSEQALECYQQALPISRQVGDREGEGSILHRLGILYYEQKRYNLALTHFLLARKSFQEIEGLDREGVQGWIDTLRKEIGEEQFAILLDQTRPIILQVGV